MNSARYPSLEDMPVLVTGGATGIGANIVRAFHEQGARIAFIDVQDQPSNALTKELPGAVYRHSDVTDIPALQDAIADIALEIGTIRVLVNNAANDKREAVEDVTVADWDVAQAINLRPQFFAAQAVRPGMAAAGGGAIINFSSIAWRLGHGDMTPYTTAKAAVLGLTNALADAFGNDNIRVNAIEPGAVMTERQRELWFKTQEDVDAVVARQLIKRALCGEDIAHMVLFLASDEAQMITKQSFAVNGGLV